MLGGKRTSPTGLGAGRAPLGLGTPFADSSAMVSVYGVKFQILLRVFQNLSNLVGITNGKASFYSYTEIQFP